MDSNFGIPTKGSLKTRRPGDICQKMESGFFHGFLSPKLFVEAMGGRLEMYAVFPDGRVKLGLDRGASNEN
jgi:hypothetical protein